MKANELRIGNWVKSNKSGNEFQFTSYYFNDLDFILTSNPPKPLIEPIPLTEEWLEKFGFQKLDDWSIMIDYYGGFLTVFLDTFKYEIFDIQKGDSYKSWRDKVKYVHQLQNLYFALTGEELTIK